MDGTDLYILYSPIYGFVSDPDCRFRPLTQGAASDPRRRTVIVSEWGDSNAYTLFKLVRMADIELITGTANDKRQRN